MSAASPVPSHSPSHSSAGNDTPSEISKAEAVGLDEEFPSQHHEIAESNVRLEVDLDSLQEEIAAYENDGVLLSEDEHPDHKTLSIYEKVIAKEKKVAKLRKKNDDLLRKIEAKQAELHVGGDSFRTIVVGSNAAIAFVVVAIILLYGGSYS